MLWFSLWWHTKSYIPDNNEECATTCVTQKEKYMKILRGEECGCKPIVGILSTIYEHKSPVF